jgi:hypothetical protein
MKNDPHAETTRPNAAMLKARAATGPIVEPAMTRPINSATSAIASAKFAEVLIACGVWPQSALGAGNCPAR